MSYSLSGHGEGCVEPLLEGAAALEDGGQEEVEQGPELGQLVLQRRPGEQETPWGHVVCVQHLRQPAVVVLHAVTFVHNHVLPADLGEEINADFDKNRCRAQQKHTLWCNHLDEHTDRANDKACNSSTITIGNKCSKCIHFFANTAYTICCNKLVLLFQH